MDAIKLIAFVQELQHILKPFCRHVLQTLLAIFSNPQVCAES